MLQLAFIDFKPGSFLLVEGNQLTDKFYIIQSGKVSAYHETPIPGVPPTMLGPGDFAGVVSCMSGHSQTENVSAVSAVRAILVRKDQYQDLIRQNTPVAMKIVRAFARDMRVLNDNLTRLTLNNTVQDTPEQLYIIASFYEAANMEDAAAFAYYQYIKACPNGAKIENAKRRFINLRKTAHPVYLESNADPIRSYQKDAMIFSECQTGNDMFIIQDGSVRISKVVNGQEVTLAILKKGDMFGEMALLENKPRSANAIAHEDCRLMVVNHKNFEQMVSTQPQYIARLTNTLAERLWSMYRQLANTQLREPIAKMMDMLTLQAEKQKIPITHNQLWNTGISTTDIISMCTISDHDKPKAVHDLENDRNVRIELGKILIKDVEELFKESAFLKKMNSKKKDD